MPKHFPSTKRKEIDGFEWLQQRIGKEFPGARLRDTMNKGSDTRAAVADAILEYDQNKFDIEIKVIGKAIPTNIRFTHQTISKARGKDLIVALIYNFDDPEKTDVKFFRLGSVWRLEDSIQVEPHFIVQKRTLDESGVLHNTLSNVLAGKPALLDLQPLTRTNKDNHWYLTIRWSD